MFRFYLRFILPPLTAFTVMLVLIHAQPNDMSQLRQLLLPEGCPAPCFMGIRPGVTTEAVAIQIINDSQWVQHYDYHPDSHIIRLLWSADAPSWLANKGRGYGGSLISINSGLVVEFRLDTNLTLADIQLIFGASFHQKVYALYQPGYTLLSYSAIYPKFGIYTNVSNTCDGKSNSITYQDKIYLVYAPVMADLPDQYNSTWADLLRTTCDK
jgi:hypothetical protein